MKVSYYCYKNYEKKIHSISDEEALVGLSAKERERAQRNLYSFVSMRPCPKRNSLFLGTTHRFGDILLEFDLKKKKFRSCGYQDSGLLRQGEVKIHKGLNLDNQEDALYFGTATLTPLPKCIDWEGGQFLRYDIGSNKFTSLGMPTPGDYYQGTLYDGTRGLVYAVTGRNALVVYNFKKKKLIRFENMQSCPHNACLDPSGKLWSVGNLVTHEFYCYDPDRNKFEFPGLAVADAPAAANVMYTGAGPVDSFVDGGDGFLYVGTPLGELYRIDYRAKTIKFLGKPFPSRRFPGLALGQDGWLYCCGGRGRASLLGRYHRGQERFEFLGEIEHKDGTCMDYVHEIAVIDNVVYAVETDNPKRSGFLWSCEL